jgi:hypothetical protein
MGVDVELHEKLDHGVIEADPDYRRITPKECPAVIPESVDLAEEFFFSSKQT